MSEPLSQYAFSNIKRSSTVERIVENLINLIKGSSIQVGEKLPPERRLCELIGVSRPILREALKALQVMNIIDIRQGAGAYLKSLEPEDVVEHLDIVFHLDSSLYHDLYEARRILEAGIARIAAVNITGEELSRIEDNISQAAGCIDNEAFFFQRDVELHGIIMKASGNRVLSVFMQSVNKLALMIRQKTNAMSNIRNNTIRDHQAILAALKSHDPEKSAAAMEEHIRNVEKAFFYETEVES
ncbi:MAG: FadR family transcriptional regulator [Treponema sp.]|jgi:GntR family transcriptional repressor for pyruvate dehydrogenase complex|nr:FadR family transcriptional regulator [Treponema sp.]